MKKELEISISKTIVCATIETPPTLLPPRLQY